MATPVINVARTYIYTVEVPTSLDEDKGALLDVLAPRCTAPVSFALTQANGVAVGFRTTDDQTAISIATAIIQGRKARLYTGTSVNRRLVAVQD